MQRLITVDELIKRLSEYEKGNRALWGITTAEDGAYNFWVSNHEALTVDYKTE